MRRNRQSGVSLVELMIAISIGLALVAGLAVIFANASTARTELERGSRQIENGRFAMELLSDELRLAGFYGELGIKGLPLPGAAPSPCSLDPADWKAALPFHLYGYDNGALAPACVPTDRKAGTDVMVVRRVSACEAGIDGCPSPGGVTPFIQVSRCATEIPMPGNNYRLGPTGSTTFDLRQRNCTTRAPLRQYFVRIFYISNDNGLGVNVPTLKRVDFNGAAFNTTSLVEGIEELNIEYGIDNDLDGNPDGYSTNPTAYVCGGGCSPTLNWANAVTARINLLSRNIEPSNNYTDAKTYTLGRDAAGAEVTVTPGDAYRRHAYSGLVRIVNAAQRRDTP